MSDRKAISDDYPMLTDGKQRFAIYVLREFRLMFVAAVQSKPAMVVFALLLGASPLVKGVSLLLGH